MGDLVGRHGLIYLSRVIVCILAGRHNKSLEPTMLSSLVVKRFSLLERFKSSVATQCQPHCGSAPAVGRRVEVAGTERYQLFHAE